MREANRRRWDRISLSLMHHERKSNRLRRKGHLRDAEHKMAAWKVCTAAMPWSVLAKHPCAFRSSTLAVLFLEVQSIFL